MGTGRHALQQLGHRWRHGGPRVEFGLSTSGAAPQRTAHRMVQRLARRLPRSQLLFPSADASDRVSRVHHSGQCGIQTGHRVRHFGATDHCLGVGSPGATPSSHSALSWPGGLSLRVLPSLRSLHLRRQRWFHHGGGVFLCHRCGVRRVVLGLADESSQDWSVPGTGGPHPRSNRTMSSPSHYLGPLRKCAYYRRTPTSRTNEIPERQITLRAYRWSTGTRGRGVAFDRSQVRSDRVRWGNVRHCVGGPVP